MTDRTAAALASALPAGITYDPDDGSLWLKGGIAEFQAERLAESGWRLVHADDPNAVQTAIGFKVALDGVERVIDPRDVVIVYPGPPQTFAEHTAEALALTHDHVELHDLDDVIAELGIDPDERGEAK
jgi:hypothetical protein